MPDEGKPDDGFAIEAYRVDTPVFEEEDLEHYINVVIESTKQELDEKRPLYPKLVIVTEDAKYIMNTPQNSEEVTEFIDILQGEFPVIKAIVYVNEQWKLTVENREQYDMYMNNPNLVAANPLKDEVMVVYAKGFGVEYWYHVNFTRNDKGEIVWQPMSQVFYEGEDTYVYDEIVLALRDMV